MTAYDSARRIASRMLREHRLVLQKADPVTLGNERRMIEEAWEEAEKEGQTAEVKQIMPKVYKQLLAEQLSAEKAERTQLVALKELCVDACTNMEIEYPSLESLSGIGKECDYSAKSFNALWTIFRHNLPEDKEKAFRCLNALWALLGGAIVDVELEIQKMLDL